MEECDAGIYIEGATSHNDQGIRDVACELFELYSYYDSHFEDQEFIIDFDSPRDDTQMKLDHPNKQITF